MYHPFLRGKQFELILLREQADLLASSKFVPILEPVKKSLRPLERALMAMEDAGAQVVLIVNPYHGVHTSNDNYLYELITREFSQSENLSIGISLYDTTTRDEVRSLLAKFENWQPTLIHNGLKNPSAVSQLLSATHSTNSNDVRHIFFEKHCGLIYRKKFETAKERVLLKDGFQRQANSRYPDTEFFSDLHLTFGMQGVTGFGDFLTVGDDYSEGGGPAYAVAIHLSFIDVDNDEQMYVHHFKSDRTDSPTDPAGKFAEALTKLAREVNAEDSKILRTDAVEEFLELHKERHFPGLGYAKKLSMQHHIETLASFLKGQPIE